MDWFLYDNGPRHKIVKDSDFLFLLMNSARCINVHIHFGQKNIIKFEFLLAFSEEDVVIQLLKM